MIVIEGPDGSGKSTLAKQLSEATGLEVVHGSVPPRSENHYVEMLQTSKDRAKEPVIQDRTPWVSHPIYEAAFHGESREKLWPHHIAGLVFMRVNLIYCRPPIEVIQRNVKNLKPKDHKSQRHIDLVQFHIEDLVTYYDKFMELVDPDCTYNWVGEGADIAFNVMVRMCKKKKAKSLRQLLALGKKMPDSNNSQRR